MPAPMAKARDSRTDPACRASAGAANRHAMPSRRAATYTARPCHSNDMRHFTIAAMCRSPTTSIESRTVRPRAGSDAGAAGSGIAAERRHAHSWRPVPHGQDGDGIPASTCSLQPAATSGSCEGSRPVRLGRRRRPSTPDCDHSAPSGKTPCGRIRSGHRIAGTCPTAGLANR